MNGFTALTGDFDNDGDLDIITTSDRTTGGFYRHEGGWRFSLVNATGAEVRAGDVRSGVALDYDRDGDLDFFLTRSDIFNLFRENTLDNGNHYLLVDPAGPGGSASAFGTRIWCYQAGRAGDPDALLGYR
ncbi:MAG TPA: VCBS repeat-containing protein, partial [bacterium]|nr:VCBS repeat-containing protein [bacterium]